MLAEDGIYPSEHGDVMRYSLGSNMENHMECDVGQNVGDGIQFRSLASHVHRRVGRFA